MDLIQLVILNECRERKVCRGTNTHKGAPGTHTAARVNGGVDNEFRRFIKIWAGGGWVCVCG